MSKKSSESKKARTRTDADRRMTAQERSVADTTVIPPKQALEPDDASPGFGPRSFDAERRHERLSYRDPEEVSQGPLRFDETNYSVERLTLPEGGYNEYADEVSSYRDEEGTPHQFHGPASSGVWRRQQNPQYDDSTQSELLESLPSTDDISPANEPDDPDLGFRLTAEDQGASSDYFEDDAKRADGSAHHSKGQTSQSSDDYLREEVYAALDSRGDIDAPNISLRVKEGTVTIEGDVSDAIVRHRIEQCVDSVEGVKDVHNRLHLAAPQPRRPWSDQ